MKSLLKHILPLFAVLVFASCGKDEAEVIPRKKMAEIYAEMLMTDQWISNTPGMKSIADTSLVYEPILEKYGYDNLDYLKSVDHYMNDPERFSRILRTSGELLEKRLKDLRKRQRQMELEHEARKKALKFKVDYTFDEYFPYLADEPYVHYYDSVAFELDSCKVYRVKAVETADTLYDRIEMIIRADSLALADSLAAGDSLVVTDSVAVTESVKEVLKTPALKRMTPVKADAEAPKMATDKKKWLEKE